MTKSERDFEKKVVKSTLLTMLVFLILVSLAWIMHNLLDPKTLSERQVSSTVRLHGQFKRGTGTLIDSIIVTSYEAVGDYKTINVTYNNFFETTTKAKLIYTDKKTGIKIFKPENIGIFQNQRITLSDLENATKLDTKSFPEFFKGAVADFHEFNSFEASFISKTKKNDLNLKMELYRVAFDYQIKPSCNVGGVLFTDSGAAGLLVSNFYESAFMIPEEEIIRVLKTKIKI
jgi:hypothetical protein